MILGFSTIWPKKMGALAGEPTNFVEQIWKGFGDEPITAEFCNALHVGNFNMEAFKTAEPKSHTIREDRLKRWKVDMDIHFYINVRKISMMQFAPVKKVIAIQEIKIEWTDADGLKRPEPNVFIDGVWFFDYEKLARNDGFPSVETFFKWFNTDFIGRIIHWTELRY